MIDWGRLVVTTIFSASAFLNLLVTRNWLHRDLPPLEKALGVTGSLLTLAFAGMVVIFYLRRGAAHASDRNPAVWVLAPLATWLPLTAPALPTNFGGPLRASAAALVIAAGTAWAIWSLRHLATAISIVPQARHLVDTGPYRFVRHPLYLGEIVALSGIALRGGHWSYALLVLVVTGLQLYRAGREEKLLAAQIPGYDAYMQRTWRVIPGVY